MNSFSLYISRYPGNKLLERWNLVSPEDEISCPLCNSDRYKVWYTLGKSQARICIDCGFRYISPRLSSTQIEEYYSNVCNNNVFNTDFEGRRHDSFNDKKERENKIKDRYLEIKLTNKFTKSGRVLDIGCGTGLYFEGLGGNYELFGIEISKSSANYTKKRFNAQVSVCNILEAEFTESLFDVVNMTYIIEHVLEVNKILNKVYTWLKPGGLLIVSSPNWGSFISYIFKELFRLNDPCQHINLWERKTLKRILEQSGFFVKNVYYPYFKTEYFNCYEIFRLFRNTVIKLSLPILLRLGYYPPLEKTLSPPCWGNIMVFECYKKITNK